MMRRFILPQGLYLSFYSAAFYYDVAHHWRRTAFVFLILIAFLVALRISFLLNHNISDVYRNHAPTYLPQLPEIVIEDGIARTREPIPRTIKQPVTGRVIAIIDTTLEQAELEESSEALLFLSSRELAYRMADDDIRIYRLEHLPDMTISRHTTHIYLGFISTWLIWILFPVLWLALYVIKLVQAMIYALIGWLGCRLFNIPLGYPAVLAVAILALAPVTMVEFVISMQRPAFAINWILSVGVGLGFVAYGIRASQQRQFESGTERDVTTKHTKSTKL